MLTDYVIIVTTTATIALIWRWILLEHPRFADSVHSIPIIGSSLYCGFCAPLWFSLIAVIFYNPLSTWEPLSGDSVGILAIRIFIGWMVVGGGVLLLRNAIAVLIELNALLTHRHQSEHTLPIIKE